MSSKWKQTRHDHFYKLAKEQGFRSRAAFKLIQINKKYDFLSKCKAVLDLCAAPGGWCQVARKFMPVSSLVIGVDLLPIRPIPGVITLQQDITTQQCKSAIKKELQTWDVDAVIHDGSPNIGGSTWTKDAYTQIELVIYSLRLSTQFLRPGGTFVTKIFRSQDYNALLWVLKQFFKKVEVMKPSASREASAEIFAVCLGYLAPSQIDPKLLDPSEVFKQVPTAPKKVDVFKQKTTRNRSGYDDDKSVLFSKISVAKFVESEEPIQVLGTYNCLEFDKDSEVYLKHSSTTAEVKELAKDLKVLGKGDFSALIKWRRKLREYRDSLLAEQAPAEDEAKAEDEVAPTAEEKEEKDQEKLSRQLEALQAQQAAKEKREAKKKKERKTKQQRRQAMSIQGGDPETGGEDLFALRQIKDANTLQQLHDMGGENGDLSLLQEDSEQEMMGKGSGEEDDDPNADDDTNRLSRMERDMNYMYQQYKKRRNIQTKERAKLGLEGEQEAELGEEDGEQIPFDSGDDEGGDNPLLVPIDTPTPDTGKEKASRWFGRDAFQDIDNLTESSTSADKKKKKNGSKPSGDDGDDEQEPNAPPAAVKGKEKGAKSKRANEASTETSSTLNKRAKKSFHDLEDDASDDSDDDDDDGVDDTAFDEEGRQIGGNAQPKGGSGKMQPRGIDSGGGFEEVAVEDDYSSDTDSKAEVLAMGSLLLKKRSREKLVNDGYNRYAFNDEEDMPDWFKDDQRASSRKQLPVTKEVVDSWKAQLKAVNARPIKKIAEAKARKKMKTAKRWEKIKGQANAVADNKELAPSEKLRAISKLYKKTDKKKQSKERVYVVSKKGGGGATAGGGSKKKGRGKVVKVDSRMKKDKRADKRIAKAKGIKLGGPGKRRPKKG